MGRYATQEEWALSPEAILIAQEEADDVTPEESAASQRAREERETIAWNSMQNLPPRWREVALLRFVKGWTRARVANLLNLTESTVRTMEGRAKVRIREDLSASRFPYLNLEAA